MFQHADDKINSLAQYGGQSAIWFASKIIGVAPFTSRSQSFGITKFNILYMILCFLVYLAAFLFSILINPIHTVKHYPVICDVGHFMHIYLGFFLIIQNYLFSPTKGKYFCMFFSQLKDVDDNLHEILKHDMTASSNDSRRFQFIVVVVGILMFSLISIFDYFVYQEFYGYYIFIVSFSYIFPYLNAAVVQSQFIGIIYAVYVRFREINKSLNYIATVHESTSNAVLMYKGIDQISISSINTVTPVLFMTGNGGDSASTNKNKKKLKNNFEKLATPGGNQKLSSVKNVKSNNQESEEIPLEIHKNMEQLFNLHDQLLDMSELINKIFSVQIVTYITISFIIILFGFFFETKVIFWLWGQNSQLILIATSFVTWGILTSIVIYTLLTICTKAREEAYESALIIHKILQNKPHFMINDEIYYNKMKSFTLQILHRKNTFNFNGLGLFNLDYTFIFSVVSAATSYLIVLLQFDLSSDLVADEDVEL